MAIAHSVMFLPMASNSGRARSNASAKPHLTTRVFRSSCALGSSEQAGQQRLRHALNAPAKASQIYRKMENLRVVQLLLGQTKLESTVRCLGIEVSDALVLSELIEL